MYYNKKYDHLGSTTLLTDATGRPTQRVEYAPFGELFLDRRDGTTWHTPYLFNAKELDEETGLYYYGARYYDPHLSLWISPDPLERKYPFFSTYSYTMNNPVRFIDPDGSIPYDKSVAYVRKSSPFGLRMHPLNNILKGHGGIDLATDGPGHDVHVIADGVVSHIGWNVKKNSKGKIIGYGRYIVVKHANGYESLYAHLEKNGVKVSVGDAVCENDVIAKSGNTGGSTGPHLHIEISKGDIFKAKNKVDPESIPDLQLLLHPDRQDYFGKEFPSVTVYGNVTTSPASLPLPYVNTEDVRIDVNKYLNNQ